MFFVQFSIAHAGLVGTSRYISGDFSDAFAMECEALRARAHRHGPDQRGDHGALRAHREAGRHA
jgi:hypothetical protein